MERNELTHHGIKGQKWGVRRFQNPDGSLTPAGKKRYGKLEAKNQRLESKAQKVSRQLEKRHKKTNRLRNRPVIFRSYKDIGRSSVKELKKSNKLERVQEQIEKNKKLMDELVPQIPPEQVSAGQELLAG